MSWRFPLFQRLGRVRSSYLVYSSRPALFSFPPSPPRYTNIISNLNGVSSYEFISRWITSRHLSYGSVNLVMSDGKPKFETLEKEPPKKEKWKSKKRLKMQRKREKRKRKEANRRDPRCIGPKGKKKKQKFPTAEARIKYKIEKAKLKESLLVEKLKKYEVPPVQGPSPKVDTLTGEEKFYMKKMAQKGSNYVPVGRRGIFGGVILNMHLHWKKHETVKVFCKPCKPGQVHVYAKELARLSGGVPIQIIGNDTIVFYRGKNYVQPEVMSPVDTLSKKRALEKSKYEQSLETVRRFIAIAEKELELYYRHVALYGDPNTRNLDFVYGSDVKDSIQLKQKGPGLLVGRNDPQLPHHSMTISEEPPDEISSNDEVFTADEPDSHEFLAKTTSDSDDECVPGIEIGLDNDLVESVADLDDDILELGVYSSNKEFSCRRDSEKLI